MNKKRSFLTMLLAVLLLINVVSSQAETIELSLPKDMPNEFIQYYWIGGSETNGVTFVIQRVSYENSELNIRVIQLPNDEYTSIVDNQVDYPDDDKDFARKLEQASQYGETLLGTLCDIKTITDAEGNNLLNEYKVSCNRDEASLIYDFCIYLDLEAIEGSINIEFVFGVNEDLSSQFSMSDTMLLTITPKE